MSLLPFFVISQAAAVGSLLARRSRGISAWIGLIGLALSALAALAIAPGEVTILGGTQLAPTAFARLFLLFGAAGGLAISLVGMTGAWRPGVPAVILGSLGWTGLALALSEPVTAVLATIGAGLAGVLVTDGTPLAGRRLGVPERELRAVAVAGGLAVAGVVVVAVQVGPPGGSSNVLVTLGNPDPAALGLAYLAMATALALRFGVIPFHRWAGRVSEGAPEAALPLLVAWAPAGFGVVALAWVQSAVSPPGAPLGFERGLIVAIGVLTILLGTFAAWIQDDLEHLVGYSMVQDAGFVMFGLAILGPDGWAPARTWILLYAIAKTALAAWALALGAAHGTRRIDDLGGWARRSPLLGAALLAIVVATIGWPGSVAWTARSDLVRLAVWDPFGWIVLLLAGSSLLYYARLARIGLRPPVGATPGREGDGARAARAIVAGLALVALVAAAGGFGIPEAARADAPVVSVGP